MSIPVNGAAFLIICFEQRDSEYIVRWGALLFVAVTSLFRSRLEMHHETKLENGPPKAAFTISEFCRRYAIGRSTAYQEHQRGRLAFRKVGARSIILASEAERWANSLPEAVK